MKVTYDQLGDEVREDAALVYVISDSLGESALNVVMSAVSQFHEGSVRIVRLSQIVGVECVRDYFDQHEDDFVTTAVFHSIVDPVLRRSVRDELNARGIMSVDILGPVVQVLAGLTGQTPKNQASAHHVVDSHYLRRVSAMEFFVAHDDGKNPQDLPKADVVLVGLTGAAKTPLAMHLSFLGYTVASVSLDPSIPVPAELSEVDPSKVFGLVTTSDVLASSRRRRLSEGGAMSQLSTNVSEIEAEQAHAREVMGSIGCSVLDTDNKTVEELAADVLSRIDPRVLRP